MKTLRPSVVKLSMSAGAARMCANVRDLELQADDVQQRGSGGHIDKQVDIAPLVVGALGNRSEHANAVRTSRHRQSQDVIVLRGKCLGGKHESTLCLRRGLKSGGSGGTQGLWSARGVDGITGNRIQAR